METFQGTSATSLLKRALGAIVHHQNKDLGRVSKKFYKQSRRLYPVSLLKLVHTVAPGADLTVPGMWNRAVKMKQMGLNRPT